MIQKEVMQTATVAYSSPCKFEIGDVFYRIERLKESKTFYEPCKVCGDKKQLTLNGVTFKCPCCNSGEGVITIGKYVARRYRVYSISDEVSNIEWKPSTDHSVKVKLYRKVGHGYASCWGDDGGTWGLSPKDIKLNPTADIITPHNIDDMVFDDYKTAVRVADILSEKEQDRLKAYNAEYGTTHVAAFTKTHDAKG